MRPAPAQTSLFDRPEMNWRLHDAESSKQAAITNEASGRASSTRALLLQGVRRWPGSTSAELAKLLDVDRVDAARKLPALRKRGLVRNGAKRTCKVTDAGNSLTWFAV